MARIIIAQPGQLIQKPQRRHLPTTEDARLPWTESDDALLREGVEVFGPKRWRDIGGKMFAPHARSPADCRARWLVLTNPRGDVDRRPWTHDEDELLAELVDEYKHHNWALVASQLPGRNAKQCRERWQNQVRPDLCRAPWSREEDAVIVALQQTCGNKWATIARELPGRTDNMVKNRWHATLARAGGEPSKAPSQKRASSAASSSSSLVPARTQAAPVARTKKPRVEASEPVVRWRRRRREDVEKEEEEREERERLAKLKARWSPRDVDALVQSVAHVLVEWQKTQQQQQQQHDGGRDKTKRRRLSTTMGDANVG